MSEISLSTPSDLEFCVTRDFDAPRKLVWEAYTNPEHLPHWMTGPDGWTMPVCEIDLREGGAWHFVWRRADGSEMEMTGSYLEIAPHSRLVSTESWGAQWPETVNTLLLTEKDGKTSLQTLIRYASKEARDAATQTGMSDGMALSFQRLEDYLRTVA